MKQRLFVGVLMAMVIAILLVVVASPVEARPRPRPVPPAATVCYESVCTWTPIGSYCVVVKVPCSSEPGVVPGGRGGTTSSGR
jgi:hypothetical protein